MSLRTRWIILWLIMGTMGTALLLEPQGHIMWVAVKMLNVHTGPTTEADVTRRLWQGETVRVLETTTDGWARIASGEAAEWVFAAHLSSKRAQ